MFSIAQFYSPSAYFPFWSAVPVEGSPPLPPLKTIAEYSTLLTAEGTEISDWFNHQDEIKSFMEKEAASDLTSVDTFIHTLTHWGSKRDPQKTLSFLMGVVPLEVLNALAIDKTKSDEIPYKNVFEWAAKQKEHCPKPDGKTFKKHIAAEWNKFRPQIFYFIPNLINIFIGAFNLLDSNKKHTSLWDKYLLLEIVYKFVLIPVCLTQLLRPFLKVTFKIYAVAAAIIAATGLLLACYQRWFKPLPNEIINCTNLDQQMELGFIDPKVGQIDEMEELLETLLAGSNVVLVGRSGEGKTALMHQLIQLKQQGKLAPELQKLRAFELNCGLMISHVSYGHSELINQTREQIEGFEDRVLFFLDEFFQLASNKEAFQAFKKRFLEDKPPTRFVAAITPEEFEQLKKLDTDKSFRRRVEFIPIESSSDEQNRLILKEFIQRKAKDVPIHKDVINKVLELSKNEDFEPGIGRPSKAIKILTRAIGTCRAAYNPDLRNLHDTDKKAESESLKKQIEKIKKLMDWHIKLREESFRLAHLIGNAGKKANSSSSSVSEADQKSYLLSDFYGIDALEKIAQEEIDQIIDKRPVQVTKELIQKTYDHFKLKQEKLHVHDTAAGA